MEGHETWLEMLWLGYNLEEWLMKGVGNEGENLFASLSKIGSSWSVLKNG